MDQICVHLAGMRQHQGKEKKDCITQNDLKTFLNKQNHLSIGLDAKEFEEALQTVMMFYGSIERGQCTLSFEELSQMFLPCANIQLFN